MAYDTGVPNASQSPALFPAQAQDNFTRLKTLLGANHKFNDSAAADDGYHQDIKMLPIATPANDATIGQGYVSDSLATNQFWWKDGSNNIFQVTPCLPLRASVLFNAAGTVIVGSTSFNVTSVTRNPAGAGNGVYRLTFTNAIPSAFYLYTVTGFDASSNPVVGGPRKSVTYGTFITTTTFDAMFVNQNGSQVTGLIGGCVMIYGG